MKVLVLGSGVIGVTSAYYLARAGHEVTVIDRQPKPALETSFANAGEVSPGYSSPWAGPGVPAVVDDEARGDRAHEHEDAHDGADPCAGAHPPHAAHRDKDAHLTRLRRIEGQVRGLSKMVDEERYCIDIVTQISAVRAALRRVEEEVLRDHVSHCVEHAIASGDKTDQRKKIAELMAVIGRADR